MASSEGDRHEETPPSEGADDGLAPGTIIGDRYRIERQLGEGGMGSVYLAEHVHIRKQLAVKVLHAGLVSAPEIVARFEREAIAAAHIDHPNVAAATDFGRLPDGSFFLVLEFVPGRSLREVIAGYTDGSFTEPGAPLEPERALRIVRAIARGVAAAHDKGIIHRDLKPENVILVDPGNGERPGGAGDLLKVLDFGIAKLELTSMSSGGGLSEAGAQPLTQVGAIFGTPDYMSPEQALGRGVDKRSDLYAIGVILYELLTGVRPFRGGAVTVLRQHVLADAPPLPEGIAAGLDPRVTAIVRRLLAKSPEARLDSATELAALLDDVLSQASFVPAVAPGAAWSPPSPPPSRGAASPSPTSMPTFQEGGLARAAAGPSPLSSPNHSPKTKGLDAIALQPTLLAHAGVAAAAPPSLPAGAGPAPRRIFTLPRVIAAGVGTTIGIVVLVLLIGAMARLKPSAVDPIASASATPDDDWTSEAWGAASAVATVPPPAVQLPPPPSPDEARAAASPPSPETRPSAAPTSTKSTKPAGKGKRGRGGGGGGIHIPPPSQWF